MTLDEIFNKATLASRLYDERKLDEAKQLTLQIEAQADHYQDEYDIAECVYYAAPLLIDIGAALHDEEMIKRGIDYLIAWTDNGYSEQPANDYYNLANGYLSLWNFRVRSTVGEGEDSNEHMLARRNYRLSTKYLNIENHDKEFACRVWTNYGNALDSIGRVVEAISAYDNALKINPNMGMALGNKGSTLRSYAFDMRGYNHLFIGEAIRLLRKALDQTDLTYGAREGLQQVLDSLNEIVALHDIMEPEKVIGIQPKGEFHQFLCEFCAKHDLFLNLVSFLGEDKKIFYGDPIFISKMYSINELEKFDRYSAFLNEIKQDYVLARYFLAQSQYPSEIIDSVDNGVDLYYSFDHAPHSAYTQLLKSAFKHALDVLDKVAYFINDYCKLKIPPDKVAFLELWGDLNSGKIKKAFEDFKSPYLFALFTLARDLFKNGDWNSLIQCRHAITHRFLVLHDLQSHDQPNPQISRESLDDFQNKTISALQIARAAIMYLILFVEEQEIIDHQDYQGPTRKIQARPIEGNQRYRPPSDKKE